MIGKRQNRAGCIKMTIPDICAEGYEIVYKVLIDVFDFLHVNLKEVNYEIGHILDLLKSTTQHCLVELTWHS